MPIFHQQYQQPLPKGSAPQPLNLIHFMNRYLFLLFISVLLSSCGLFDKEQRRDQLFLKGKLALQAGESGKAEKYFSQAIDFDPQFVEALNNRGVARRQQGKTGEAIDDFSQALALDPNFTGAYYNRSQAYLDYKEYYQSLRDIRQVEKVHADTLPVFFTKGLIYMQLHQYEQSLKAFNTAIQKSPENIELWVNRASCYYYAGQYVQARKDVDHLLEIAPNYAYAYNVLGLIESAEEHFHKAISAYNEAVKLKSGEPYFLNNRAYAYIRLGDLGPAQTDLNRSIQLDPYNQWAYRNRARLYIEKKNFAKAITLLERVYAKDKNIPLTTNYLSYAYAQSGDLSKACEWWQKYEAADEVLKGEFPEPECR